MIPISKVEFDQDVENLVLEVLRSGFVAQGPKVTQLEEDFARAYGVKHVIAVNNGTTAIIAALRAHEIGPGDEVITTPFTFAATLNAVLEVGATPVFVDISYGDFNIDASQIEDAITQNTRAIMPVHLYGQMANITELTSIAEKHNLVLIQDSAQAQGARFDGIYAGATQTATFSLYATKNMTTGEGGLVTTDNDEVAARLRTLRNQGMRARYEYVMPGFNWRLTDLQAALAIPQLRKYDELVGRRTANANFYIENLSEISGLTLPTVSAGASHVWHQFTIRVNENSLMTRQKFVEEMTKYGVGTGIYYPRAVYDYEAFRAHPLVTPKQCLEAERAASEVVSIPVHQYLTDSDLTEVTETIHKVMGI